MEQSLSFQAKREVLQRMAAQYRQVSASEKRTLLESFIAITGYVRKYARWLLNHAEKVQQTRGRSHLRRYGPDVQQALDPIRLFQQVELLQKAVFRWAMSCPPFVSHTPSAPIRIFSVECCIAGNVLAEGSVPDPPAAFHALYQEQEPRKRVLGWRRTYKGPFEGEWEQITSWVIANPERSSGDIFRELQCCSPECYHPMQIRTLQRGMCKIRAHLLEPLEEQWQDEVIHGRSPAPGRPVEETASIFSTARSA